MLKLWPAYQQSDTGSVGAPLISHWYRFRNGASQVAGRLANVVTSPWGPSQSSVMGHAASMPHFCAEQSTSEKPRSI